MIATVKISGNVVYVDFASVPKTKFQTPSWRPKSTTTTSMPQHVNFESSARVSPKSDDIDQILNKLREEMSKFG
jgi:hypothetical protein